MLKACARLLGLYRDSHREAKRKKELGGASVSLDLCLQSKDISVRIIHAGGREELYQYALPASQLMEKYPGMCVARPEVFKNPQESLLWPDENLLPGHKYLIIPYATARKLKCKHMDKVPFRGSSEGNDETLDVNITWDVGGDMSEESVCSAKEFYESKDRLPKYLVRKSVRAKKPFVPPLPKARSFQGLGWEPSLTSVKELSP